MQDHLAKPIAADKLGACIVKWQRGERAPVAAGRGNVVERLRPEFDALKTQVNVAARAWLDAPDGDADLQRLSTSLSTSLHQLAGVAALFGDVRIGTLSAQCERCFHDASTENSYRHADDTIMEPLTELVRATG